MKPELELLIAARKLIEKPEGWTQWSLARDTRGERCGLAAKRAKSDSDDMDAAIRAYLEARDLVLVPKEPMMETQDAIWLAAQLQNANDQYRAMIAAAPDPFKDD